MKSKSSVAAFIRLLQLVGMGAVFLQGACADILAGEDPPTSDFMYFPSTLAVNAGGANDGFYVLNTNFDQRFNYAWVQQFGFAEIVQLADAGQSNISTALKSSISVPNLPFRLSFSNSGDVAALSARGGRPIVLFYVDSSGTLSCGNAEATAELSVEERRTDCDDEHFIRVYKRIRENASFPARNTTGEIAREFFEDPLDLKFFSNEGREDLLVGYDGSSTGTGSLLSVFNTDTRAHTHLINIGSTGLAGLLLDGGRADGELHVLAASRPPTDSQVIDVNLGKFLAEEETSFRTLALGSVFGGDGIADFQYVDASNSWLALASRGSNGLHVVDMRLETVVSSDSDGLTTTTEERPRYRWLASTPLPGEPTDIELFTQGGETFAAVTVYEDDSLYLFALDFADSGEPISWKTRGRLDHIGDGPLSALFFSELGRSFLAVTLFNDHKLTLVEVTGDSLNALKQLVTFVSASE